MVPKHMQEILQEAFNEALDQPMAYELVETVAIKNLIRYVDDLEAELIVRRAADTPNAKVVTLKYSPKELDITDSQVVQ